MRLNGKPISIDQGAALAFVITTLALRVASRQPPGWEDLLSLVIVYGLYKGKLWALELLVVLALLYSALVAYWNIRGLYVSWGYYPALVQVLAFGVYSAYRIRQIAKQNKSKSLPPPPPAQALK
jgi:hypothetical protein